MNPEERWTTKIKMDSFRKQEWKEMRAWCAAHYPDSAYVWAYANQVWFEQGKDATVFLLRWG
jgi:hypothetical protein